MARKNWVPAHSILVMRPVDDKKPDGDQKQVDAYQVYKETGKAFTFTDDEVAEIQALDAASLISPTNQDPVDTESQGAVAPGTDTASPDGRKVATPAKTNKDDQL